MIRTNICKLCVVHYLPIEQYPPLQNLMEALGAQERMSSVIFCGSVEALEHHSQVVTENMVAYYSPFTHDGGWRQKCEFAKRVRIESLKRQFDCVLAFGDELSGLVCSRITSKVKALHLHELPPKLSFRNKYISKTLFFEIVMLHFAIRRFRWVSQVTPKRAEIFSRRFHVQCRNLFNFPPASFTSINLEKRENRRLRVIYVGSCNPISVQVSTLKVLCRSQKVELSVLPTNTQGLEQLKNLRGIKVLDRVPYPELPGLLQQFDVGLILYNGHSDNMRFGVPNKLAEYLRCGLHVVYHNALESVTEFVNACKLNSMVHMLPQDISRQVEYIETEVSERVGQPVPELSDLTFEQEYQQFFEFLLSEKAAANAENENHLDR